MHPTHLRFEDALRLTHSRRAMLRRADRVHRNATTSRETKGKLHDPRTRVRLTQHELTLIALGEAGTEDAPDGSRQGGLRLRSESARFRVEMISRIDPDAPAKVGRQQVWREHSTDPRYDPPQIA